MIREILIYLCTFVCVVSAGVVYWGMESNLKILSDIKTLLKEWAEGGADEEK